MQKMKLYNLKRKKGSILILILFAGLFSGIACQDVLDITPTDSLTEEQVFDDPALLQAFVNDAYRMTPYGFQEHGGLLPLSNLVDEAHSKGNTSTVGQIVDGHARPSFLHALDVWTGGSTTSRQNRNFKSYWVPIQQANEFLAKTADSQVDQEVLTTLTGEIKTLRAYAYFRLISHYGGVPLVTEPFNLDNWQVSRDSYDDVMNFVIDELNEAIEMLPLDRSQENMGRLTKGAAMAVKARALLYAASPLNNPTNDQAKWQAAADAAKDVIDLNRYELYPNYLEVFIEGNSYNSEIIWSRPFIHIQDSEVFLERRLFPNGWQGHGHTPPLQNLVDAYETENGLLPENDPSYDPQNPYVNRDPRFYDTILFDGAPFKERTLETFIPNGRDSFQGEVSAFNASETGYNLKKFITEEVDDIGSGNTNAPWIYIRYAEVLLNYAEAMFELGNEGVAREYVNKVRSRPSVQMPDVTESGQELWNRIVHERRIELAFEEHRFFDVRRWKIATEVLSVDHKRMQVVKDPDTGEKQYNILDLKPANFNEHNYLSPIPLSEIERNPLLEQNPGY
jgi:starch-binding outer membrane protein, SusD/RagB family